MKLLPIVFFINHLLNNTFCLFVFVSQRLQLDKTSKVDPLELLDKISSGGISQDVCINDLGTYLKISMVSLFLFLRFIYASCIPSSLYMS